MVLIVCATRWWFRRGRLINYSAVVSIFLFGVAYWAPHRVHYDKEWAQSEGYDNVLVTAPLITSYLVRMLTDWGGDGTSLKQITTRNLLPAYAGDKLEMRGEVTAKHSSGRLRVALSVMKNGKEEIVSGEAILELGQSQSPKGSGPLA